MAIPPSVLVTETSVATSSPPPVPGPTQVVPSAPATPRISGDLRQEDNQRRSVLKIVIALVISLVEVVLSMKNAVEEDSWKLTHNEQDFVYSASSLMEVVGLMFGLVSFFFGANDRRFSTLGLPLVVISNGVLEDDREMRMLGFGGVVVQTIFIVVLLAVWLILADHLYFMIIVPAGFLGVHAYWIYDRTCSRGGSVGHVGGYGGAVLLSTFRSNEAEVPRGICYLLAVMLVCSPPVIEVLECFYLLRDISLDTLGLLIADALTILPGVVWLLLQIRSFRRNTPRNSIELPV